ncbi:hypothetical protein [Photobacterium sp. GB-1]|uniref:hypothetical protein n=1 Tax=Photobacterium sp. GB-1 TaxID=2022111 RepID=UPI0011B1FE4A|nr:hypothetical protein [Photobacterium sp. GB-1]
MNYTTNYLGNKALGNDVSFSWKNLAASAAGSLVNLGASGLTDGLGVVGDTLSGFAGAATSSAIRGESFSDNAGQMLTDAFGNALGNSIKGIMEKREKLESLLGSLETQSSDDYSFWDELDEQQPGFGLRRVSHNTLPANFEDHDLYLALKEVNEEFLEDPSGFSELDIYSKEQRRALAVAAIEGNVQDFDTIKFAYDQQNELKLARVRELTRDGVVMRLSGAEDDFMYHERLEGYVDTYDLLKGSLSAFTEEQLATTLNSFEGLPEYSDTGKQLMSLVSNGDEYEFYAAMGPVDYVINSEDATLPRYGDGVRAFATLTGGIAQVAAAVHPASAATGSLRGIMLTHGVGNITDAYSQFRNLGVPFPRLPEQYGLNGNFAKNSVYGLLSEDNLGSIGLSGREREILFHSVDLGLSWGSKISTVGASNTDSLSKVFLPKRTPNDALDSFGKLNDSAADYMNLEAIIKAMGQQ